MWKKIFFQTAKKCSIRTMIRFVYPNVNAAEQFVGCGRYFVTTPDDPCLTDGYTIAEPNVGHLSKVTTAASLLAKESFDSDREIYESQDDPATPYVGDSMGLAYLLALIHRSRSTIWEKRGGSLDIWCTGAIEVAGGMPILSNVYRNLFDIKLTAFLSDVKDPLFIVPVANLEPKHRQLVRQQHVRVLSLDQFSTSFVQEIVERKTIVKVHGDELAVLVHAIFEKPSMIQLKTVQVIVAPEDEPPFKVEAVTYEQDTFLILSTTHIVKDSGESTKQLGTQAHEIKPVAPGRVLVRGKSPIKFLAIVHDFNEEPSWKEEWIEGALNQIFRESESRKLQAIAMPLLGTLYGSLEKHRFFTLLRLAIERASLTHLKYLWLVVPESRIV